MVKRIKGAFSSGGHAALMPYFTIGYPDLPTSLEIITACCRAGADLMELGVPFSDPLADGPTIQHSTQVALENGTNVRACIDMVRTLRGSGVDTPFVLMGYTNPVLRYGVRAFVEASAEAGVDGLILPDLPPDEAGDIREACAAHDLALVHLLSPNSTPERVKLVLEHTAGFVYLVSVTGITGARDALPPALGAFIARVRAAAPPGIPLAVGFGIGTPEHARAVAAEADGVIVGSALIQCVREAIERGKDPVNAAEQFVSALADAVA